MPARPREDEDGAEGYFASISDLMVGILFIFLLMLTVFALNFADDDSKATIERLTTERNIARQERDQARRELDAANTALDEARLRLSRQAQEITRLGEEIARLRMEVEAFAQREARRNAELTALLERLSQIETEISGESRRLLEMRRRLLAQLQENLRARRIDVQISEQQDVLRLPSEEIFQIASAAFTLGGRERITILLEEMARLLPCFASAAPASACEGTAPIFETILIEGHTDTVRFDNWRLSTDRARAVMDLMTGSLAPLTELRNAAGQTLLGLAGYGESRPLPHIAGADPRNRRIEVRFLLSAAREAELASFRASLGALRQRLEALRTP